MFLKNNFNLFKFLILTLINWCIAICLIGAELSLVVTILFLGFISNQLLLLYGVNQVTLRNNNTSAFKLIIIFIGKFLILAGSVVYALSCLEDSAMYALIFYIFQLIILVISIKRIPKKVKDKIL